MGELWRPRCAPDTKQRATEREKSTVQGMTAQETPKQETPLPGTLLPGTGGEWPREALPRAEWAEGEKHTAAAAQRAATAYKEQRRALKAERAQARYHAAEAAFEAALREEALPEAVVGRIRERRHLLGRDLEAVMGPGLVDLWEELDYRRWVLADEGYDACPYKEHDSEEVGVVMQL